ncbi:MAG: CopD family protein [Saprospiraceae bacterium]|nr:CopD family protein [Saprospiraceae bacterium]
METLLLIIKVFHILGFVAWVGGLFYLANIMVYHRRAIDHATSESHIVPAVFDKIEHGVYRKMCNPAMMLTWTAGIIMLVIHGMDWFKVNLWMHHKLLLLILLTVYHLLLKIQMTKLHQRTHQMTTLQFQFFNAIPVLFLAAIVVLAIFRNSDPLVQPIVVLSMSAALLYIFAKVKKNKKGSNQNNASS